MPIYIGSGTGNLIYSQSSGSIKYGDSFVSTQLPVYTWGSHPNPWDVPFGTEILIHPNCLTGYGANTCGIKFRSDTVNWRFADSQILYGVSGTVASPLVSGIAGSAAEFNLLGSLAQPMIPAYMLYKGARGVFRCKVRKTGANGTFDMIVRLGYQAGYGSLATNGALINQAAVANVNNRDFWVTVEFIITDAGPAGTANMIVTNIIVPNSPATAAFNDRNTTTTTIADMYFNIDSKNANASDTFSLLEYSLEMKPQ